MIDVGNCIQDGTRAHQSRVVVNTCTCLIVALRPPQNVHWCTRTLRAGFCLPDVESSTILTPPQLEGADVP
jgi:hypothetical protein